MYIVGITGASGPVIGVRLVEELLRSGKEVASVVTPAAWGIMGHEMGPGGKWHSSLRELLGERGSTGGLQLLREYAHDDMFAPPASGSFKFDAVVVAPCSMKTLAGIATGFADTLIGRAADVALKEGRRCILVPRETPLNLIHLENLLKAKKAGADILVPVPGFYTRPRTVDDVVDFIVGKILNLLGIEHNLFRPWGTEQ